MGGMDDMGGMMGGMDDMQDGGALGGGADGEEMGAIGFTGGADPSSKRAGGGEADTAFDGIFGGLKDKEAEVAPGDAVSDPSLTHSQSRSGSGKAASSIGTGWSARSLKMLRFLQTKMPEDGDSVTFSDVSDGATQANTAQGFLEMLVLMARGKIVLEQDRSYGEIVMHQAPGFFADVSGQTPSDPAGAAAGKPARASRRS
jgi:hypothetical protein